MRKPRCASRGRGESKQRGVPGLLLGRTLSLVRVPRLVPFHNLHPYPIDKSMRVAVARRLATCLSIYITPPGLVPLCSVLALNRVHVAATLSEPRSSRLMAPWKSPDPPRRYANYFPNCKSWDGGHPTGIHPRGENRVSHLFQVSLDVVASRGTSIL